MTAILVILMVVAVFAIDAIKLSIKRRRGEAPEPEAVPTFSPVKFPKGLFLGENHSWARLTELGELKVGVDELLTQALGFVDEVEIVPAGQPVRKGERLAVIHRLGHSIEVTSLVDGTVVAVNQEMETESYGVHQDPYGRGWLAKIWPTEHAEALRDMKVGDRAVSWLNHEVQRFTDFLVARTTPGVVGAIAADGAHPLVGAACSMDEEGWREFEQEFARIQ